MAKRKTKKKVMRCVILHKSKKRSEATQSFAHLFASDNPRHQEKLTEEERQDGIKAVKNMPCGSKKKHSKWYYIQKAKKKKKKRR